MSSRPIQNLALSICAAAALIAVLATTAAAVDMRPATKVEIERYVERDGGKWTTKSNGYSYKQGSKKGYKFSNGQICVLQADSSVGCAKILTDGQKFRMIMADGSRYPF